MFSGAISMKIKSETNILAVRYKTLWLAEKVGFDKIWASTLSTIISEIARLLLSQTSSSRIDVLSRHNKIKKGITVLTFLEQTEREELEKELYEKLTKLKRTDLDSIYTKNIFDEFKIFRDNRRDLVMEITKWV